jgi:uncharacterized membrane protein
VLLTLSYLLHVIAAGFWTGAVLFVAYVLVPDAGRGVVGRDAYVVQLDRLLRVTRWTGVVLPITGLYQIWVLYPWDRLVGTVDGWLVLSMFGLWGLLNGVVELGVFVVRKEADPVGYDTFLREGFPPEALTAELTLERLHQLGRPYLLVSVLLAVLLLANAALLAAPGLPL